MAKVNPCDGTCNVYLSELAQSKRLVKELKAALLKMVEVYSDENDCYSNGYGEDADALRAAKTVLSKLEDTI